MLLTVIDRLKFQGGKSGENRLAGFTATGTFLKFLFTMKLMLVLTFGFCFAANAGGYAQKINLSEQNATLKSVFNKIENQTGYYFIYRDEWINKAKKVTIRTKNATLDEVLKLCFQDQPLTFSLVGNTVVIKEKQQPAETIRENIDVTGKVVDAKGDGIPGVTITEKGTKNATASDENGFFILKNVSDDAVLVFTGTNVETHEVSVGGRKTLSVIALKFKLTAVEEIVLTVNTGYQSLSKERSAGSFAKPDMSIVENRSTSMNILQRLDGLIPGLTVNNSPMSANPLLVRGLTTVGEGSAASSGSSPAGTVTISLNDMQSGASSVSTDRSPLFVVDGIVMDDVSSINPQDIADMTVLKDATAASIWGARASNGVIIMTTKKGGLNEKIKVKYDAFINFQGKPDLGYVPVLTSEQFIQSVKDIYTDEYTSLTSWNTATAYTNTGSSGLPPHAVIMYKLNGGLISQQQADKSLDSLARLNNHNQIKDLFYRNSSLMNHTVSLSGGGRIHSFYGSLAYTNTVSPRPGEKNNSFKVNLRQDLNITKWLNLYLITDLTNNITSSDRQPAIDYRFFPYQMFQDASGNNLSTPYMGYLSDSIRVDFENRSLVSLDYNPLDEIYNGFRKNDLFLARVTGGAKIKLFNGLNFEGVYGLLKSNNRSTSFDNENSYLVRSELVQFTVAPTIGSVPQYFLPTSGGLYSVSSSNNKNWTVRNQLVYDKGWNNNLHQISILAGQEAQEQLGIINTNVARGYNVDLETSASVDYKTLGSTGVTGTVMPNSTSRSLLSGNPFIQRETQIRFTSYYANAAYTYNKKYTINGSWRIDKSNLFGIDKSAQNRPVWSAGLKWNLINEQFLQKAEWLNALALRGTYGITGNSPLPGTAASYDIISAETGGFMPNNLGYGISTASNPKLRWESTQTLNFGLDFSVLNNRLWGSIDYYSKKTEDLLGNMSVDPFTGYSMIIGNFGTMTNSGVEFSINSMNVQNRNFRWNTTVSLAYNKNMITQLNDPRAITTGNQKVNSQFATGYPAFAIFAYQFAGLDDMGDPQIKLNDDDKTITKAPDAAKPDDILFMGTYQPVWSGGVSNLFRYKNFTIAANAVLNLGHVMRRDVGPNYANSGYYGGDIFTHGNALSQSTQAGFTGGQLHPDFLNRWKKPGDEAFTNVPSYVASSSVNSSRRDVNYYRRADINVVSASFIKMRDITFMYSLPEKLLNKIQTENIALRFQVSNIMLWKANKFDIDPEFHNASAGTRVPSSPSITDPTINTTSYRFGQGTITVGIHVNF